MELMGIEPNTQLDSPLSPLLGGSGIVISRVLSPLIWVTRKVTLLITTPEPPSKP